MKAGKKNDSPVVIFTINCSSTCLNSALAKYLLASAFKPTDHAPHFLPDRLWGSPRTIQLPSTKQYIWPQGCLQGLLEAQTFQIRSMKQSGRYFPHLVWLCVSLLRARYPHLKSMVMKKQGEDSSLARMHSFSNTEYWCQQLSWACRHDEQRQTYPWAQAAYGPEGETGYAVPQK